MLEIKNVRPTAGMYTALWTFNGVLWSGTVYECPNCGQQMMYNQNAASEPEFWCAMNMPEDYVRCEMVGYIQSERVCPAVECCNCFMKYQDWVCANISGAAIDKFEDGLKAPNPAPF